MNFEVAITSTANLTSSQHLLRHYNHGESQEDLCFALWRPSTGRSRYTALIDEIVLPEEGERILHGNASFEPDYLARSIKLAREKEAGLAFMHSHPNPGWQEMSETDVRAERDVLAWPSRATGFPLLGLTVGTDGCWSARFWEKHGKRMRRHWCEKVRVVGPRSYRLHFNDNISEAPLRKEIIRRTFDTWGCQS